MNRKKQNLLKSLVFSGSLLFAVSCEKERPPLELISSDGSNVTRIAVEGGNGTVHVSKSANGTDIKLSETSYYISGDTLVLPNPWPGTAYVEMPNLQSLHIYNGNNSTTLESDVLDENFLVEQNGNSTVKLSDPGKTGVSLQSMTVHLYANGTFKGSDLPVDVVDITVYSNGTGKVRAKDVLKVDIQSNGRVIYKGNPSVDQTLSFQADLDHWL